jgi:hypothetical protein
MNKTYQLSLLDFKSSIAACLCKQNKEGQRKRGRPSSSVEGEIQLKKSHWPQFTEKRGCSKKTWMYWCTQSALYKMQTSLFYSKFKLFN